VKKQLVEKYSKDLDIETKLVYFSPALKYANTRVIIPYYECSITEHHKDDSIKYLDELVPAIKDMRYVPNANVTAFKAGEGIKEKVDIEGGLPPYTIQWNVGGKVKSYENEAFIYNLDVRDKVNKLAISATITDQNGISVSTGTTIAFDPSMIGIVDYPIAILANYRQFVTENSVTNRFGELEQGFVDQTLDDGVTKRFQWKGIWAWEQDFKSPKDYYYIDNTNITLYVGYGNPEYFTFEDITHDDYKLDHNDADNDLGDRNLEWLALYSCKVLRAYPKSPAALNVIHTNAKWSKAM
jgi:hypothetical protein